MTDNWKKKTVLFLVSQSVTLFGSTLVQMAIVWFVTLETQSGAWVSAFTVCSYLPQFLISIPGGAWADRYDKKKLIIFADAVIALATLILWALCPLIDGRTPLLAALLAVSVVRSLGAGVQTPAVNAVLPRLVPEAQLMRYNGINATMQSAVQFAAPAAAGAVLSLYTLRSALIIDVATAAVGVGILACLALPKTEPKPPAPLLLDIKEGVRYSVSERLIGRLLLTYGLFIFLSVPAGFLATLLVSRVYGDTYWYLTAVELTGFAGMAAGGVLMSTWGGFKNRHTTLALGLASFGALAIGMGASRSFILYLALMLLYGVALTSVQTAATTLIQENAAPEKQGRVFGLMGSMYSLFLPVGMAIFGPLADLAPLTWIMALSGVLLIALALYSRSGQRTGK